MRRRIITGFSWVCLFVLLFVGCNFNPLIDVPSATNPTSVVSSGPQPYTFPELPLAVDELPTLEQTLYELEIIDKDQYNLMAPLAKFENGNQVLLSYGMIIDSSQSAEFISGELLLVDQNLTILGKKPIEKGKRCSPGKSFYPDKGCFVLGNEICVVNENLEVQTISFDPDTRLSNLCMTSRGDFWGQTGQQKEVCKVDQQGNKREVYNNPDDLPVGYEAFDAPDQFRLYTDKEIWRMNEAGEKQIILDDFNDMEIMGVNSEWDKTSMFYKVKYSSDGKYAYFSLNSVDTENISFERVSTKDLGYYTGSTNGCAVLLRYKAQEDGTLAFDKELFTYHLELLSYNADNDPYAYPPMTVEYMEDVNGNEYLVYYLYTIKNPLLYHYEAYAIDENGLNPEVAFQYSVPTDSDMEEIFRNQNLSKAKLQILLGFQTLDSDNSMAFLWEGWDFSTGEMGGMRQSIVSINFMNTKKENQKPISVYMMDGLADNISNIKIEFEKDNPDYRLDIQLFDSLDKLRTQLSTELLAGKGPDLIYCYPMPFINPVKTMGNGYLLDMAPYLDQNPDFDMSGYYQQVLDVGIVEGKRYVVPFEFDFVPTYTTQSALGKAGLQAGDTLTVTKLMGLCTGPNDYIVTSLQFNDYFHYRHLLNMGVPMSDSLTGTALFDQPAFQKALPLLKELYQNQGSVKFDDLTEAKRIQEGAFMVWNPRVVYSGEELYRWEAAMEELGEKGAVLAPPTVEGCKPAGVIHAALAVNANAKEKEGAVRFVQYVLGEETQTKLGTVWGTRGVPVHKRAFEAQIQYFMKEPIEDKITEEYIAPYRRLLDSMGVCQFVDLELEKMVNEQVEKYCKDEISLEQLTRELMQKVGLYLKE